MCVLVPSMLISPTTLHAQSGQVATLAGQMEAYYTERAEEQIHLHLSSQMENAGRDLYFQAYVLDAYTHLPTTKSKVLRLELWDADLTARHHTQRTKIVDGIAQGALNLPVELSPGVYTLMAYTQWLLNYSPAVQYPIVVDQQGDYKRLRPATDDMAFFPEGGHLAAGVVNKVAVRAGEALTGKIIDRNEQVVASFTTDDLGSGAFVFVPEMNETYRVEVNEQRLNQTFPQVEARALALLLKQTSSGFRINLQATQGLQRTLTSGVISVIVEAQGIAYFSIAGDIKATGYFVADLESSALPNGPARISVFDHQQNLLAERVFYNVNPRPLDTPFSMSKNSATRRDKVALALFNNTENPLKASVSVTKVDHLVSDLPGIDASDLKPAYEASAPGSADIDLLMLTGAWKPGAWSEILGLDTAVRHHDHRAEQLLSYSGRAFGTNGNPLADKRLDVWLVNEDQVYQTDTDEGGYFNLIIFDFTGRDNFLFGDREGELASVEMNEGLAKSSIGTPVLIMAEKDKDYSYKRKVREVYDFYDSDAGEKGRMQRVDLSASADYTVDLDKYIDFGSMQEMFVEVVAGVLIRDLNQVRVYLEQAGKYAARPPLFMVNGRPTYDQDWILRLDPSTIASISVLNSQESLAKYRSIGQNGIVAIQLESTTEVPAPAHYAPALDGLAPYARPDFPNYDHAQQHARMPDLREILHWESGIEVAPGLQYDITFFTSDVVGRYEVKVEGVTADGQLLSIIEVLEVNAVIK